MKSIPKRFQNNNNLPLLRFALDNVREAVYMIDKTAHFQFVNDEACRSLGFSRDEFMTMSLADIDPDKNWPADYWFERWQELRERGSITFEARHRKKSGELFPVEINANFFEFEGEEYNLALVRDISERKQASNISKLHSEILLHVQEGVQLTRVSDETIVYSTPVFNRMFGYEENELIGRKVSVLNAPTSKPPERTAEEINRILKATGSWHGEIHNIRKDGSPLWCWVNITTFEHHEYGEVWVAVHEDITRRKQAEMELEQARDNSHRELLVREVHHRIKNNLQGITGVLRRHATKNPHTAELLNQAISQVQSIAVIHGLQGRTSLSMVRLCELTDEIANGIQSMWQKPIMIDIPDMWRPWMIMESEAVPLALILNELVSNAIKHGQDGEIRIQLRCNGQGVRLSIENTGMLPEPFDHAQTSSTGLKLVSSLLPRRGASLTWHQEGNCVVTLLELGSPVITRTDPFPETNE